ncbi:MAG: FeoB-associated Cys-rich membrane protein [Bacteroidota bacterium]
MQEILTYICLALAVGFLVRKFFWKKKSKKNGCGDNCDCK